MKGKPARKRLDLLLDALQPGQQMGQQALLSNFVPLAQAVETPQQAEQPDPTLYDHLGDIYAELKAFDKAREAWRKSVQLEPNDQVKKKLQTTPAVTAPTK